MRESAKMFAENLLYSIIPPDIPLPYEIVGARYTGKQKAIVDLKMFDGQKGVIEIFITGGINGYRWLELDGAINWDGSKWVREESDTE